MPSFLTPLFRRNLPDIPDHDRLQLRGREALEQLAAFLEKHDLMIVDDQSFKRTSYDGKEYITFATLPA